MDLTEVNKRIKKKIRCLLKVAVRTAILTPASGYGVIAVTRSSSFCELEGFQKYLLFKAVLVFIMGICSEW